MYYSVNGLIQIKIKYRRGVQTETKIDLVTKYQSLLAMTFVQFKIWNSCYCLLQCRYQLQPTFTTTDKETGWQKRTDASSSS